MGPGGASQLVAAPGPAQNGVADQPIAYVNGKRHVLPQGRAEATLLQWLRGETAFLLQCFSQVQRLSRCLLARLWASDASQTYLWSITMVAKACSTRVRCSLCRQLGYLRNQQLRP